jgi:hypothetical protein
MIVLLLLLIVIVRISTGFCIHRGVCSRTPSTASFLHVDSSHPRTHHHRFGVVVIKTSRLFNSLKPAAVPLMDAGKALARSGELLIELTTAMDIYGGSLSAVGAQVRNAGDSVAQAAASCRFKTGVELVTDELRESGTCLTEAVKKLELAVQEAKADSAPLLASNLGMCRGCVPVSCLL